MAFSAAQVESSAWLRLLILGGPKVGKTYTTITTAPVDGGIYVINSDDKFSLRQAAQARPFEWNLALGKDLAAVEVCLREAREGVKAGTYKTVIWDTMTKYSDRVVDVFAEATKNDKGEPDGRRYWLNYKKHLHGIIDRLFMLNAHVIVNAHYLDVAGALIDGQLEKSGNGVVPLLGGQCRATIPAEFQDVVFLEKRLVKGEARRVFVTSAEGVFGPGCRSLRPGDDVNVLPAHVGDLWKRMKSDSKPATSNSNSKVAKESKHA